MKTTHIVALSLVLSGCVTAPPVATNGPIQFNYKLSNAAATGLLQVFEMDGNTVLQMAEIGPQKPIVVNTDGAQLQYSVVGQYLVLPGIQNSVRLLAGSIVAVVERNSSVPVPRAIPGENAGKEARSTMQASWPAQPVQHLAGITGAPVNQARYVDDSEALQGELQRIRKELADLKSLLETSGGTKDLRVVQLASPSPSSDVVVVRVNFKFKSSAFDPPPETKALLQEHAARAGHISIRGFTDSPSHTARDLAIANSRASAAKRYLVKNGVDERKVHVSAQATGGFIADNSTADGRAQNRRVEIEFL